MTRDVGHNADGVGTMIKRLEQLHLVREPLRLVVVDGMDGVTGIFGNTRLRLLAKYLHICLDCKNNTIKH